MIEIRNLTKSFGALEVLKGVHAGGMEEERRIPLIVVESREAR